MAYFSNGTEGDMYQEQYCCRCEHDKEHKCPVWNLHLLYSYRLCTAKNGNPGKVMLDTLIPMSKDSLTAEKCSMFVERSAQIPLL